MSSPAINRDHPALANRHKLAAALNNSATDIRAAADTFEAVYRETPGLLPLADLKGASSFLREVSAAIPNNLLAQFCLAESLWREDEKAAAQPLFIDVIRRLRPSNTLPKNPSTISEADFRSRSQGAAIWHSVDLGSLFVEGRRKDSRVMAQEMLMMEMPDVTGRTVLDIGAFGGWFSFEAERRGALAVTALEYYSWVVSTDKLNTWIAQQRAAGLPYNPYQPPEHVLDERTLPGRRAFDAAKTVLGSGCKPLVGIFERLPDDAIGMHDITFHLGVLYHVEDPFGSIRKLSRLTRECAVIETLGYYLPGRPDFAAWRFFGNGEVNNDPTTFWAPSEIGLRDMCLSAGFKRVDIKYGWNVSFPYRTDAPQLCRIWAHAWK